MVRRLIRKALADALDVAETYILGAPAETVGLLPVDLQGNPVEIHSPVNPGIELRKATAEPEAIGAIKDASEDWDKARRTDL